MVEDISKKNEQVDARVPMEFDEDAFLLDYIEYQKGNINAYNYAVKYKITVSELFDKLREYCLNVIGGANI